MKTITTIVILFFFNLSYGQVYEFDKLIKNTFSTKTRANQEKVKLFNTKDYSYYMQIYSQNDSLKSRIFDLKTNKIHLFNVSQIDSMQLKYHKTISFKNNLKNQPYEFSEVKNKNGKKTIKLTILNQKRRKIAKYKLTIENDTLELFSAFKLSGALHPYELSNIIPPHNFKVLKSQGVNDSGNYVKYELKSIEDIKIAVEVP